MASSAATPVIISTLSNPGRSSSPITSVSVPEDKFKLLEARLTGGTNSRGTPASFGRDPNFGHAMNPASPTPAGGATATATATATAPPATTKASPTRSKRRGRKPQNPSRRPPSVAGKSPGRGSGSRKRARQDATPALPPHTPAASPTTPTATAPAATTPATAQEQPQAREGITGTTAIPATLADAGSEMNVIRGTSDSRGSMGRTLEAFFGGRNHQPHKKRPRSRGPSTSGATDMVSDTSSNESARSSRSARRAVAATGFGSPGYVAPTTTQAGAIAASVAHAPTTTPRASAVAAASPAAVAGAGAGVVVVGSQQGGAGVPRLLTSQSGPLRPRPSRPAEARTAELEAQLKELQAKLTLEESRSSQLRSRVTTLEVELDKQLETVREIKAADAARKAHSASVLEGLFREIIERDVELNRKQLAERQHTTGHVVTTRQQYSVREEWVDGQKMRDIARRTSQLQKRREELSAKAALITKVKKKRRRLAQAASSAGGAGGGAGAGSGALKPAYAVPTPGVSARDPNNEFAHLEGLDFVVAEESVRTQQTTLKREEAALADELKRAQAAKAVLLREIKRMRDEDASDFVKRPVLNSRYLLMHLLGKGGFSEVWKAMDLVEIREVAVKIHQLKNNWSDAKKANYVKHAAREYSIHKDLQHGRIVSMHDVFEINSESFATVLELCRGSDLDMLLKEQDMLNERETRSIIVQVVSALRYLHNYRDAAGMRKQIIHYDLKPANILMDNSKGVKVTDFGLSKVLSEEAAGPGATSMELTSQGAGTYWYLPPECFERQPRISNKVDVWSLGVIMFEMLYGRRPYGAGKSQEHVLRDGDILRARAVEFPAKPSVSEDAKAFMRACLTASQADRPNIDKLCSYKFLVGNSRK